MSQMGTVITDIALAVTRIIEKHDTVDWQTNKDIHNRIAQEIDDLFYELEKERGFQVDFCISKKRNGELVFRHVGFLIELNGNASAGLRNDGSF